MNSFSPISENFNPLTSSRGNIQGSLSTKLFMSHKQSANVTLFTSEGDRVTLSAASHVQSTQNSYEHLAQDQKGTAYSSEESFGFSANAGFSVSVEGHLNEQELQDLGSAMQSIEEMMNNFLSGEDETSLDKALQIVQMESIAAFDAQFSMENIVSIERKFEGQITSDRPGNLGALTTLDNTEALTQVEQLLDAMEELVEDSGLEAQYFMDPLEKLFTGLLQNEEEQSDSLNTNNTLVNLIQEGLFGRLNTSNPPNFSQFA